MIFGHLVDAKFEPALHPSAMNEQTRVQVEALFQRYRLVSQLLQMALSCLYLHDDVTDTAEQHVSQELNYQLAQSAFPLRALVTECHQELGRIRNELFVTSYVNYFHGSKSTKLPNPAVRLWTEDLKMKSPIQKSELHSAEFFACEIE